MENLDYLKWIIKEDGKIEDDDHKIQCFRIDYNHDESILNEWALQIRRNYISDAELDEECSNLDIDYETYLKSFVIPQKGDPMWSTARSNAFSEILVADILQYIYSYTVPRYRFNNMSGKNVSEHGSDVIGYHINDRTRPSKKDKLVVVEVKASLSKKSSHMIVAALEDSKRNDYQRLAYSLNYMRRKLDRMNLKEAADDVLRFQQKTSEDMDYTIDYVAAGVNSLVNLTKVIDTTGIKYIIPGITKDDVSINKQSSIFFIHGEDLMALAHTLFERCIK